MQAFSQTDSLSFSFGKNEGKLPATYVLTGKITDRITQEPVQGVGIQLDGIFSRISTDRLGTYLLNISPGIHKVTFRHVSKIPIFTQVTLYDNGVINLSLEEKSFELEGVVVLSELSNRNVRDHIT